MPLRQTGACSRLSTLGFRQYQVHDLLNEVHDWSHKNGWGWTIKRLKALKTMYIQHLAGNTSYRVPWIACDGLGRPKGAFKVLWMPLFEDPTKGRKVFRSLSALMIYSSQVANDLTKDQWKKLSTSVENPPPVLGTVRKLLPKRLRQVYRKLPMYELYPDLGRLRLSPSRFVPVTQNGRTHSVPETSLEDWFPAHWHNPWLWKIAYQYPENGLRGWLLHLIQGQTYRLSKPKGLTPCVGKVSFIQEPGWKLRAVANPNRVLQLYLEPLKRVILRLLRNLDQDCTHNQGKGVERVQRWLSEGRKVHSVDLSDATNNFPLDIQDFILSKLLDPSFSGLLLAFNQASRGPWRIKDPVLGLERDIRWSKGQPLGLGPSFGSFALAHHAIIRPYTLDYVVLGDDICICGDSARDSYLKALRTLGCPVSPDKTLSSTKAAEFAGKVITAKDVYPQYKWRECSDRSFIDIMRHLGPTGVRLLRRRQRIVIEKMCRVPEYLGGLGWNPEGLSLDERIERYSKEIQALESERTKDVPATKVDRRRLEFALRLGICGEIPSMVSHTDVLAHVREADQAPNPDSSVETWRRVVETTHQTKLDVPEGFPRSGLLPDVEKVDPRGPSTLEIYEEKLDLSRLSPKKTRRFM